MLVLSLFTVGAVTSAVIAGVESQPVDWPSPGDVAIGIGAGCTHVSRAMVKLGARDRAQLVVFAYQSGLVDL